MASVLQVHSGQCYGKQSSIFQEVRQRRMVTTSDAVQHPWRAKTYLASILFLWHSINTCTEKSLLNLNT